MYQEAPTSGNVASENVAKTDEDKRRNRIKGEMSVGGTGGFEAE